MLLQAKIGTCRKHHPASNNILILLSIAWGEIEKEIVISCHVDDFDKKNCDCYKRQSCNAWLIWSLNPFNKCYKYQKYKKIVDVWGFSTQNTCFCERKVFWSGDNFLAQNIYSRTACVIIARSWILTLKRSRIMENLAVLDLLYLRHYRRLLNTNPKKKQN